MKYVIRSIEQLAQFNVGKIVIDEPKGWMICQQRQIGIFELTRVVIQELVDSHHLVARRKQLLRQMRADKAGNSGYH
jgi:hypothetical protein